MVQRYEKILNPANFLKEKSEVLSEVLSEVFAKHLTLQNPFLQRHFRRKSEVLRCFC